MKKLLSVTSWTIFMLLAKPSQALEIKHETIKMSLGAIEISTPVDAMDLGDNDAIAKVYFNGNEIYSNDGVIFFVEQKNIEENFVVIAEGGGGNWCAADSYRVIKITKNSEVKVSKRIQDEMECYGELESAKKNPEGKIVLKFDGEKGKKKVTASFE